MRAFRVTAVLIVGLSVLLSSKPVAALDVNVSSTTSTQIYEVRGGQPGLFLTRRRVTQRLGLRATRLWPGEDEPGYEGPRISLNLLLRIDADFGHNRRELQPANELWFVPGYDPYGVDLMILQLVVEDLFRRTTDVRAGRLITFDPTGFSALDGAEISVRLPWNLRLWVQIGAEVVNGQRLSSGSFEVDGVLRMRRDDLFPEDYAEFEEPATRFVIAGGASLIDVDWLTVDVAYRQGIVRSEESQTSYQRVAGAASLRAGLFRGGVIAAGDLALAEIDELTVELGVRPSSWLRVDLVGSYDAPVFDTDSIFAAFWSDPALDVSLRLETRLTPGFVLGASGLVRQVGFLSATDEPFDVDGLRYGGTAYGRLHRRGLSGEIRGRMSLGYGGRRVGVTAHFAARLPRTPVSLDLRGIVLGLRDDLEPEDHLITLGYVFGARYRLSHDAALIFELEHNASHRLGQQFRFLVLLDLGVWI